MKMDKITIKAENRELQGRKVKKLRNEGLVPANIFGRDVKSVAVQVDQKDLTKVFAKAGETNIVEVELGKETRPVLIHNIQYHPVEGQILHVDFLQVDLKKKVKAEVPVELIGESPAEKQALGTVVQYVDEIEVEALPTEIPDKFEVDISILAEVDQMIQVKDIKVDVSKVEIKADIESLVAKVEPPKEEKEEIPATPVESEEGYNEGGATEGEGTPAEETTEAESKKQTSKLS